MTELAPAHPDQARVCENCQAINSAQARICRSCGAHLEQVAAAVARLDAVQQETAETRSLERQRLTGRWLRQELARSHRRLRRQLAAALVVVVLIGLTSFRLFTWHQDQLRLQQARLAAEAQQAAGCLASQDYRCARDGLFAVLREAPAYPGAAAELAQARYGLAQQYAAAGQWQRALTELNALLAVTPGDQRYLALEKSVYDRWLADAIGKGDFFTAWRIAQQRDAHFPPAKASPATPGVGTTSAPAAPNTGAKPIPPAPQGGM